VFVLRRRLPACLVMHSGYLRKEPACCIHMCAREREKRGTGVKEIKGVCLAAAKMNVVSQSSVPANETKQK
jgi:hypothetical protein